eukprot:3943134-Prymnesium_polylepis.1
MRRSQATSMHAVSAARAPSAKVSTRAAQKPAWRQAAGSEKEPAPTAHLIKLIATCNGDESF